MTSTPFLLSGGAFTQDWSNIGLITTDDNWSGVPSIQGFRGDNPTAGTGIDPRTVLADETTLDVNANQTNPSTFGTGGVAEFEISDPVVALQGSGTADAPFLVFYLNTLGRQNIRVRYNVRDIDGSADDAVQQVALQFRIGNTGNFVDVPAGYIADATTGGTATQVTAIDITLPAAVNNQSEVQVRVITTNAVGNDELVGIDDINITSTPQAGAGVIVTQSGGSTDVTEGGATDTFTIALNSAPTGDVNFSFNTGAQVTVSPANLTFTTANFATPQTITVTAVDDAAVEGLHTGTIQPIAASADAAYNNIAITPITANITDNEVLVTRISTIQGTGTAATPGTFTIEGIVVGDFQATGQIGGFFVQEEDADADTNPLTSEGISVFSTTPVSVGDKVRVTGTVSEFGSIAGRTLTQIGSSPTVTIISSGNTLPTAATIDLPSSTLLDGLEQFEGMRVTIPETLTVSETFTLARFGQIQLSADGRRFQPTEFVDPNDSPASGTNSTGSSNVPAVTAQQSLNDRRAILLDDGLSAQNGATIPYLNAQNTRRIGDTVTGLTGILDQRFASTTNPVDATGYRIQPTGTVTFADTNPRPLTPPSVGGSLKVGSFNLLNYFTTLDNGTNVTGPNNNLEPRGSENTTEFTRQREKTATTIFQLNADILGLIELENNGTTAITDLVNAVNAKAGAGTYAFIQDPVGYTTFAGGDDAIKVAFIYKPSVVTPVGNALAPNDASFFQLGRAPVAQTFIQNSNGAIFTPVINHFKSKGAGGATGSNLDQNDGQSAFNAQRKLQAQALVNFVNNTVIPTAKDADVLILGDLNAYGEEDPVDLIRNAGFIDQIDRFDGNDTSYSFVFQGQSGRLDHALANSSLNNQVTGAAEWHINADEPIFLDYNLNFKATPPNDLGFNTGSTPDFFNANNPFRSSDHDPALVGLNLAPTASSAASGTIISRPTAGGNLALGTNTNDNITGSANADTIAAFAGDDTIFAAGGNDSVDGGFGNDTLSGSNGNDTLIGNIGNDILIGGFDSDRLIGGDGNDVFVYNTIGEGNDTIVDFTDSQDRFRISSQVGTTFGIADGNINAVASGANTIVYVENGTLGFQGTESVLATLLNFPVASFSVLDISFVI